MFKKGVSGNPHGRPRKETCFTDTARQMLSAKKIDITYTYAGPSGPVEKHVYIKADKNFHHGVIAAMIQEALSGNTTAARDLINRIEGMPRQSLDVSTLGKSLQTPTILVGDAITATALKDVIDRERNVPDDKNI
jgi:hypothetical protein